jgi:hypothetical protein
VFYYIQEGEKDSQLLPVIQSYTQPPTHAQKQSNTTHGTRLTKPPPPPKKWCSFTYIGKETSTITKIFKETNLQTAYHTNNTIQKHLSHNNPPPNKFTCSGIYKLTCTDCNKAYIGQTGRDFYARFNEHNTAFKYNTSHSKFAQHLNTNRHAFGNIEKITEIIQI